MRVDDIRLCGEHVLVHRAAGEPGGRVRVARAVYGAAGDPLRVVDEHDADTVALDARVLHTRSRRAAGDRMCEAVVRNAKPVAIDRAVERQVQGDVVTEGCER